MTFLSKLKGIFGAAPIAAAVAVATPVVQTEISKALTAIQGTEVGAAAIAAVKAAELPDANGKVKTGAAKKLAAVAAVVPVLVLHVAKVGLAATMTDLETFAGMIVESTLADLKKTGVLTIASAVIQLAAKAAG